MQPCRTRVVSLQKLVRAHLSHGHSAGCESNIAESRINGVRGAILLVSTIAIMTGTADFARVLIKSGVFQHDSQRGFTLKSGKQSDYFLNFGNLATGEALLEAGTAYWNTLKQHIDPQRAAKITLLGPAYKGIPLAVATAMAAARDPVSGISLEMAYTRKEAKDHGEGGVLVGSPPQEWGEVWLIDDVISFATAFGETKNLVEKQGKKIYGMLVGVDRCELGQDSERTVSELLRDSGEISEFAAVATVEEVKQEYGNSLRASAG